MALPLKIEIHTDECPRSERPDNDGPCYCTPEERLLSGLNDRDVMTAIHGGRPFRVKFLGIVTPPPNFATYRPPQERSQADRHRAISD
jgi:hypothetical protein